MRFSLLAPLMHLLVGCVSLVLVLYAGLPARAQIAVAPPEFAAAGRYRVSLDVARSTDGEIELRGGQRRRSPALPEHIQLSLEPDSLPELLGFYRVYIRARSDQAWRRAPARWRPLPRVFDVSMYCRVYGCPPPPRQVLLMWWPGGPEEHLLLLAHELDALVGWMVPRAEDGVTRVIMAEPSRCSCSCDGAAMAGETCR